MPRKASNKQLQIEVTQQTSDLVGKAAAKLGITKAEYIRQAVYDALEHDGLPPDERIAGRGKYLRNKGDEDAT